MMFQPGDVIQVDKINVTEWRKHSGLLGTVQASNDPDMDNLNLFREGSSKFEYIRLENGIEVWLPSRLLCLIEPAEHRECLE